MLCWRLFARVIAFSFYFCFLFLLLMKVSIIGSGNVATWLAFALNRAKVAVRQVYSRTFPHAESVAAMCSATPISSLSDLQPGCDFYIFALRDDAYGEVLSQIPFKMQFAVHTAGSLSQNILQDVADNFGILYPFQTISKSADLSSLEVPLCVEASNENTLLKVRELAQMLSPKVYDMNESQRGTLHVAAVFASNFSNALYDIAYKMLKEANMDWQLMMPLLQQTLNKTTIMPPCEAQTGPAVRHDSVVMQKHLQSLSSDQQKQIYQLLSDYIQSMSK